MWFLALFNSGIDWFMNIWKSIYWHHIALMYFSCCVVTDIGNNLAITGLSCGYIWQIQCISEWFHTRPDIETESPVRRQAITWAYAWLLSIRLQNTHFNEISILIQIFLFKKMRLKTSSTKWCPFFTSMCWIVLICGGLMKFDVTHTLHDYFTASETPLQIQQPWRICEHSGNPLRMIR